MRDASRQTLFVSLRRDRLLFAVIATLVLLLQAIQPLAAASGPSGLLPICTLYGIDKGSAAEDAPAGALDDCPVCLIAACSGFVVSKAMPDAWHGFVVPSRPNHLLLPARLEFGPAGRQGEPSPAIRAPPASV